MDKNMMESGRVVPMIELHKVFANYAPLPWYKDMIGLASKRIEPLIEGVDINPAFIKKVRDLADGSYMKVDANAEVILSSGGSFYTQESRQEIRALREQALKASI